MLIQSSFSPQRALRVLLNVSAVLSALHLVLLYLREGHGIKAKALTMLFDLDHEANVPTLFMVGLFLVNGLLLWSLMRLDRPNGRKRWQWLLLSFVFVFLAIDEGSQIHEKSIEAMHRLMGSIPHSALLYAWVIPYGLACLALGIVLGKFLLSLPKRTLFLMVASGCIFIGGALGVEMLEGAATVFGGETSIFYLLLNALEEIMEMIGLSLFVYTLLDHLTSFRPEFTLRLAQQ